VVDVTAEDVGTAVGDVLVTTVLFNVPFVLWGGTVLVGDGIVWLLDNCVVAVIGRHIQNKLYLILINLSGIRVK
jgi:hypothetical protein